MSKILIRRFLLSLILGAVSLLLWPNSAWAQRERPFEFFRGEMVAMVGDTFIERSQKYGHIEAALTLEYPQYEVRFRNLGWSADLPTGQSRASFDWNKGQDYWLRNLLTQIAAVKPTTILLGYGMAASFEGEAGLNQFSTSIRRLIDGVQALNLRPGVPVRFIVVGPTAHETLGAPLPNPNAHNRDLALYTGALRGIARSYGFPFISLYEALQNRMSVEPDTRLTDNGIHLNDYGYLRAAEIIRRGLGWKNLNLVTLAETAAYQELRETILEKNELFFHRWRPQNQTYLFGFRKHEQGQNAIEIPKFDPLVAEREARIRQLRHLPSVIPADPQEQAPISDQGFIHPQKQQTVPEFQVADGLKVELWAENPLLAKPIHMNFDSQGRLWVASSSVYPQIQPGQPASDTLVVLEDKNRDGKAESSSVFADGLLIPTGVAVGDGGVYVGQSTELLFFKDKDGDGKADERQVVLSGFGTEDTHHIVHSLRWGPDSALYFNQSIYIHSHIETPHGVRRLNSGGVWRLDTKTLDLDVLVKGFCNPWGHDFDQYGQSFITDGAGFQGVSYGLPGAMYFTYAGARRTLQSISPGAYPKFAGLEILRSQMFPEDWQGDMITCDFRAHRVVRFKPTDQGSGFQTQEMPDLLRSESVTFRPIDVKLGPDGALYVGDWSNPIIQHGEVDFRDPRRDQVHGRIWRISRDADSKTDSKTDSINFASATTPDLLPLTVSKNAYTSLNAKRAISERSDLPVHQNSDSWSQLVSTEEGKLNALWLLQGQGKIDLPLLSSTLQSGSGSVRAGAIRVASRWLNHLTPSALDYLAPFTRDAHGRVRIETFRALAKLNSLEAANLILAGFDLSSDPFHEYAIWLSVNDVAEVWLQALQQGQWAINGREDQLEYALQAIEPSKASSVLGGLLAAREKDSWHRGPWIELIGSAGGPNEIRALYDHTFHPSLKKAARVRALRSLEKAARFRKVLPAGGLPNLDEHFLSADSDTRIAALNYCAMAQQSNLHSAHLQAIAHSETASVPVRMAAIRCIQQLGQEGLASLNRLSSEGVALPIRRAAARELLALSKGKEAKAAITTLAAMNDTKALQEYWRELLSIKNAAQGILRALPDSGYPAAAAKAGLRISREGGRQEPELQLALARSAGLDSAELALTDAEMKALAKEATDTGDPHRGEIVYRRNELACVMCHAIGGVGGLVGPDLTSIGASAPVDYLVESLFYPNRKIKEGYHSVMVETLDGEVIAGVKVSETTDQMTVRGPTGLESVLPKARIQATQSTGSMMPSGLADSLTHQERLDLFRFLSELGKPGDFDASQGNTVRVWQVLPTTHRIEQFGIKKVTAGQWEGIRDVRPANTSVNGQLSRQNLRDHLKWNNPNLHAVGVFLKTAIDVPKRLTPKLRWEGPQDEVSVWLNGTPIDLSSLTQLTLSPGTQTLVFRIDPKALPDYVRLSCDQGTFKIW